MTQTALDVLAESRLIVVGTARNVAATISSEIDTLTKSLRNTKSLAFFIVESDSNDRTIETLNELTITHQHFNYVSLGRLQSTIPSRIERIAYSRNVYLDYVKQRANNFDFVVVVDLDGVNKLINERKILSCFENLNWGGCMANQLGPYYDVYALRADGWCESNCWEKAKELVESGTHPLKAWRIAIRDKQKIIKKSSPWIRVDSAFGGFAIYKVEAFIQGYYSTSTIGEKDVSEHVPFNKMLTSKGWSLFINPALINFNYNEHNDFHRLSRRINYAIKYFFSAFFPNFFIRNFMPEFSPAGTVNE